MGAWNCNFSSFKEIMEESLMKEVKLPRRTCGLHFLEGLEELTLSIKKRRPIPLALVLHKGAVHNFLSRVMGIHLD